MKYLISVTALLLAICIVYVMYCWMIMNQATVGFENSDSPVVLNIFISLVGIIFTAIMLVISVRFWKLAKAS